MGKSLVCLCNFITEDEILKALKKGARSTSDIQKLTNAGTSCGRCLVVIDAIVDEYISGLPEDPQQTIDFQ
jgi:bacterioferritin-associated ferredoxin